MRLPAFMDPYRASTPTFGLVLLAAAALGGIYAVAHHNNPTHDTPHPLSATAYPLPPASDDEPGFDCRTQGARVCGSDVVGLDPGLYPAPDGHSYTVLLVTPHDACVHAGDIGGPSGYAPEVCEVLRSDFEVPVATVRARDFRADGCVTIRHLLYCPKVKP